MNRVKFALVSLALMLCHAAQAQWIIAHRGASQDAPENTLAAFREAFAQGADGVEGDFYLSSDGQVVCIHDKDTKRTAGKKLLVKDTSFEELRSLDVGAWKGDQWRGERIASLDEVIDAIPPDKKFVIELKIGPEIVKPLERILAKSGISPDQILIISFNADTIAECERRMPDLCTHWLTGYKQQDDGRFSPSVDEVIATIQKCHADGLGSEARTDYFNADFVNRLRAGGCEQFHVWTVDDPKVAQFYQDLGTRWITTNRPGWLKDQLAGAVSGGSN
jgi:glycerophosphoryl diester phosphodiesterase